MCTNGEIQSKKSPNDAILISKVDFKTLEGIFSRVTKSLRNVVPTTPGKRMIGVVIAIAKE